MEQKTSLYKSNALHLLQHTTQVRVSLKPSRLSFLCLSRPSFLLYFSYFYFIARRVLKPRGHTQIVLKDSVINTHRSFYPNPIVLYIISLRVQHHVRHTIIRIISQGFLLDQSCYSYCCRKPSFANAF